MLGEALRRAPSQINEPTDLLDLVRRALTAARPYLLEGRGPREESKRAGMLLDQALAERGEPQGETDWDD